MHRATFIVIATALLAGCSTGSKPLRPGESYPSTLKKTEPSNMQMVRTSRHVEMTNTTARGIGPSRIWLNEWYGTDIDGIAVGDTLRLPLTRFTDEFGDSFRGGGFFAAEAPDILRKAELQTEIQGEPVLVPLIVVGDQQ